MQDKGLLTKLAGVVEADETYISRRRRRGHPIRHERIQDEIDLGLRPKKKPPPYQTKPDDLRMVERGGRVRTMVVPATSSRTLRPIHLRDGRHRQHHPDNRLTSGLPADEVRGGAPYDQPRARVRPRDRPHADH